MKKRNILLGLALTLGLASCYDLDKQPQGVLSTSDPFRTIGEIQNYVNRNYETAVRVQGFMAGGGGGMAGNDVNSDDMSGSTANTRLMGQLSVANGGSLYDFYYNIRAVNFLLENSQNCDAVGTTAYNQLIGEAHYFRAWYYYAMITEYGEVPWVEKPIDPKIELLMLPRDNRTFIIDKILADLDAAITLMGEQNSSAGMRIHRDVARALKSEIALYAATWEKYHYMKEKNQPEKFYDTALTEAELMAKIDSYLEQSIAAAEAIRQRGVWKIYNTGNVNNDYRVIFETANLGNNPEILWFKMYDGDQVGNSVTRYLNTGGGGIGITANLVDDYLTIDGRPFVGEEKMAAKRNYPNELLPTVRDPRLSQTVALPGQRLQPESPTAYVVSWPALAGDGTAFGTNLTGYVMLKHIQIDYSGDYISEYKGSTPSIQFRYADVLLNYAEALAEQDGAANAGKIIEILQPLRDRAGMPGVDFDREYNTSADYPFKNLNKYVQAVRRERHVEKALEGRRLFDIQRWAAADELIIGRRPQGALFIGSNLPEHYTTLKYDQPNNNNLYLSGTAGDAERYILPVPPSSMPDGWQFKPNRDYLLPIKESMINLMDGLWPQNPGW
ncbi:RagB/SusD family nutrient uptake outer membrane protein [Bacteroides fluxus]|uniref:SusD family protein n=1 Tax=Bacteroides fluxus YIT 12057 TaxID=763034 RepID=F3PW28_9BACE|nr:RagB/SusD family nutrient uptake outer membrane protein [Bacteroides fluxus]EGF52606.1 SusD family protein [Bacteroides fluxus YIT 12057]